MNKPFSEKLIQTIQQTTKIWKKKTAVKCRHLGVFNASSKNLSDIYISIFIYLFIYIYRERETERQRETERDRERQRERQRETERDRETERCY